MVILYVHTLIHSSFSLTTSKNIKTKLTNIRCTCASIILVSTLVVIILVYNHNYKLVLINFLIPKSTLESEIIFKPLIIIKIDALDNEIS